MAKYQDLYHRLLAWIDEPANEQACWVHRLQSRHDRYIKVNLYLNGKHTTAFAHVLMWEWFNGPRPEGHDIDHMCHNTRCVNPDHLQALTHKDNRSKKSVDNELQQGL